MKMKNDIAKALKEKIDEAKILAKKTNSEEIAEYLADSSIIPFPLKIGDTAYFISVRTAFGSILTNGVIVERKVDALQYDGRIKIVSHRPNPNDTVGNLYEYYGDLVFNTYENAKKRLDEIKNSK